MIVDLHCHSTASDGALHPRELVRRAAANGVDVLAITDHDTVDAYAELSASTSDDPRIVPGIEFSSQWRGRSLHVVGLDIDIHNPTLVDAVRKQKAARAKRAVSIAERLHKLGFEDTLEGVRRIAGDRPIGRPDFARHLVETGRVKSIAAAFKKYLGSGKPGDIRSGWATLETVVDWITAAGGVAVLAHPGKYRMTNAKLGLLADEFSASGGAAIEVICGQQSPDLTSKLARLCADRGLRASRGSDFHAPDQPWSELGCGGALPATCRPVWELFDRA